jgi:hypothetical protein
VRSGSAGITAQVSRGSLGADNPQRRRSPGRLEDPGLPRSGRRYYEKSGLDQGAADKDAPPVAEGRAAREEGGRLYALGDG